MFRIHHPVRLLAVLLVGLSFAIFDVAHADAGGDVAVELRDLLVERVVVQGEDSIAGHCSSDSHGGGL